jgi:hypothetical protein
MATDPEIPERGYSTSDVAQQAVPKKPGWARRNWGKVTLFLLLGVPALVFAAWTAIAMSYTYSSGERIGFVQKLGKKGWVCKTWEGELQMSNIPGSAPTLFNFTVRSDSVAKLIQAAEGRQVALQYSQHVGIPLSCMGDTEYFIDGVRVVGTSPGLVVPPPTPTPTMPPATTQPTVP